MEAHDGGPYTHDVFLSFRGPDTGDNFTDFLYDYLKREEIDAYMDREDLRAGEEIQQALFQAIQGSKILIPVFSKNYANSRWCLDELVAIVRCHEDNRRIILPIFLDVKPEHVRHQTESFARSFEILEVRFDAPTIQTWREALVKVANLSGYVLADLNGKQLKLIDDVVDRVLSELIRGRLSEVEHLVGLGGPVQILSSQLNVDSNDVQFLAICGIGGIGKTTIAKALYNKNYKKFDTCFFLTNIREEASRPKGLISLQEQLLSGVFNNEGNKIWNVHRGQQLIKERLRRKKVLLILDDVDCRSQLDALVIKPETFHHGSWIIITSRDEHILNLAKVEGNTYCLKEFQNEQSLELFSRHAFLDNKPPSEYEKLSQDVISLAGGLPLTLEVLGSAFFNIKEEEVWKRMLQRLKRIPCREVHKRLKLSYENLEDDEKSMFLDAACFFVGWNKERVISIWKAYGFDVISAIEKLTQRSLLKFDSSDELRMHNEIQAMGRGIVYEESPIKLGKRSRLWDDDDILDVLKERKGTKMIEGILSPSVLFSRVYLQKKDFAMMSNLRILKIDGANYKGDYKRDLPCFPSTLIWFRWRGCPLKNLPKNFCPNKLVYMDLTGSRISQAWSNMPLKIDQRFQNLEVLLLRSCDRLRESPNFSWFPSLKTLDLGLCINMLKLHQSIGDLKSLVELCLDKTNIEVLPERICNLSSLKVLTLKSCSSLKNLPDSIGDLESLINLSLDGTKIEVLPDSICRLNSLQILRLKQCSSLENLPNRIGDLSSLVELCLEGTKIAVLPDSFRMLRSLQVLDLSRCTSFTGLPDSIGEVQSLVTLCLDGCSLVNSLPVSMNNLNEGVLSIDGTKVPRSQYVALLDKVESRKSQD